MHFREQVSTDLERKRAESDALFLSIGEGAVATDEHGQVARINQVALGLLGYKAEEILGHGYCAVVVAEDEDGHVIPYTERPITQVLTTGRSIATRVKYRCKDGSKIMVYLTVSPVVLDGEPIGAIEVFRNITREVELETAKDEFISLASHQLRTPASVVKQYAGMLLQGYAGSLTEQQLMMIQNVYDSNERQINIVNDLLRVAQVDAGKVKLKPEPIDIVRIVKDVAGEQTPKFVSRNQRITCVAAIPHLYAMVDAHLIRMVIENIIDNASKYTPAGKAVEITIRTRQRKAIIDVKDEGVGISKRDIPQVFRKFSRLPNPLSDTVGGTGLGLYWAKKVMDLHGGTIKVQSRLDKGTTFSMTIPLEHKSDA